MAGGDISVGGQKQRRARSSLQFSEQIERLLLLNSEDIAGKLVENHKVNWCQQLSLWQMEKDLVNSL